MKGTDAKDLLGCVVAVPPLDRSGALVTVIDAATMRPDADAAEEAAT